MKKNVFYSLMVRLIPELIILKKKISWDKFVDYSCECNMSDTSICNSPFNLQRVKINDFTYIDKNSNISNTSIGKFCSIGPNLFCGWGIHPINGLTTSPMFYSTKIQNGFSYSKVDKIEERKQIFIGNDVFIGANVIILDGVVIGDGAIIGAGAVISKDIPAYAVAVGCPIKIIKYRFEPEQIKALLKIQWWNFEDTKLKDVEKYFFDIDTFIHKYAK